jgi:hypothetical protein
VSTGTIVQLAVAPTQQHDITLAREQTVATALPQGFICLADSGYQGLVLDGGTVLYPFKKPKHRELEPEEKAFNRRLAQLRVMVEHRIRCVKVFRLLKGVYRNRRRRFELRLRLIAGLINQMITHH